MKEPQIGLILIISLLFLSVLVTSIDLVYASASTLADVINECIISARVYIPF
jgi:hypothetical protein